jgi:hypothetical protein
VTDPNSTKEIRTSAQIQKSAATINYTRDDGYSFYKSFLHENELKGLGRRQGEMYENSCVPDSINNSTEVVIYPSSNSYLFQINYE